LRTILLRWVRDFAQVRANKKITRETAMSARCSASTAMDSTKRTNASSSAHPQFGGGPVGLNSLAVSVAEDAARLRCE